VFKEDNIPLIGVSVSIKGSSIGTTTDAGDKFTIQTAKDADLVFSFVGYATKEVQVDSRTKIEMIMKVMSHHWISWLW
jgi:hypothetical protein